MEAMSSAVLARPSQQGAPQRAPRRFLPEVQALRALAVTLVVIYHLYPAAAPGGFVGVDVFFVISGFLITSHLLREATSTGRISLPKFWAARIRRIMPAAIVTVLAVVAATFAWWPPSQWAEISRQAIASLLSVENWVLAADSVDYLAADNAPTAVQHFWSLGVEEQFYVAWPLLVLAAAFVASRVKSRRLSARGLSALVFTAVIVVSLVYSIHLVRSGDPAAYFVTTARVWELAAGGLLAAILPAAGWAAHNTVRVTTALLGVAVLAGVAAFYTDRTPFPGQGAILPVLGTLAVIAAGRTAGLGSLHRLTDWAPVQWVGNASYSLYLWHWPVYIVATQLLGRRFHWWEALALTALSLLLAWISYRWIETPTRRWKPISRGPWRAVLAGSLATAVALGLAVVPTLRASAITEQQQAAAAQLLASKPDGFGAAAWQSADGAAFVDGTAIVPTAATVSRDQPDSRCMAKWDATSVKPCTLGDTTASRTIALVGDSHAHQWMDALDTIAKAEHFKLQVFTRASCPFSLTPRTLQRDRHTNCTATNAQTLDTLVKEKPDAVIVASWTGSAYVSDPRPGFAQAYQRLSDAGITPVVLRDTPWGTLPGDQYVRDCVAMHPADPSSCGFSRKAALHTDGAVDAAKQLGLAVIDPTSWFCSDTRCPAVVGNVIVWRDKNHVSDTYLSTVIPQLGRELDAALG